MRGWVLAAVLSMGCGVETQIDGMFSESEWEFAQTFRMDTLPAAACVFCSAADAGHQLFFDPRLSGAMTVSSDLGDVDDIGKVSCASCHDPAKWFVDSRSRPNASSLGNSWTKRNTLGIVNSVYQTTLAWDGGYRDLEAVFDLPVTSPAALNTSRAKVAWTVWSSYGGLVQYFGPSGYDEDEMYSRAARALAAYESQLISGDAPLDRYLAGDTTAISEDAKRGLKVFIGRGLCSECHNGPLLADGKFYTTGVAQEGDHAPVTDDGRGNVTGAIADVGRFRTPTLRQVAETGPYMHAGQLATLTEVIDLYRWGGAAAGFSGEKDPRIVPLEISDQDARDLEAFMRTLTGAPVPARLTAPPVLP